MELQKVVTQYIVSVRIRKRDWTNGTWGRMVQKAWTFKGDCPGMYLPSNVISWSNRVKIEFIFPTGEDAYTFHTWVKNGCK